MHNAPEDLLPLRGFHSVCYILENDTAHVNSRCENLLVGLPHYNTASGLIHAGGNYGCWMGRSYPDPDMLNSCYDDFQHNLVLSNCFGCTGMSICIRYPAFEPADSGVHLPNDA